MVFDFKGQGANVRLPKKEYLTFRELAEEWRMREKDLFHFVATGKISPSTFLSGYAGAVEILNENGRPHFSPDDIPFDTPRTSFINGFLYLTFRQFIDNVNQVHFWVASEKRAPDIGDFAYSVYQINGKSSGFLFKLQQMHVGDLVHVPEEIVFLREEIDRFEREHMQNPPEKNDKQKSNDSLDGKARTTALKLIGGLVMDAYGMDIHANRLTGVSDLVSNLAGKGIALTEETVSNWIKEAAQVIEKPKS